MSGLNVRIIEVLAYNKLSVVGKIYVGILVDKICRVTGSLIEQGDFRVGRGCVDQVFTLNEIGEKA